MAAFIKTAATYFVALYPQSSTGGTARINLYCDTHRLYVIFKKNPAEANTFDAASKTGVAYADISQFPYYLDLVRNEKPISVTFNPDVTPPNYVVHANEPVGDGDV